MGNSNSHQQPQPCPTSHPKTTTTNHESSETQAKNNNQKTVDKETERQNKGLHMKHCCQVVNYCEVPIRVFAINHAQFLQKIQKKSRKFENPNEDPRKSNEIQRISTDV